MNSQLSVMLRLLPWSSLPLASSLIMLAQAFSRKLNGMINIQPFKYKLKGDENELHKAVVAEKTRELRQLNDEELQGCTLEELQTLEERLERGLSRVSKTKDERILKQINALKRKGIQLKEENQRMKQSLVHGQGQSSESIIICSSSDINPPQDSDSSDTSLRLGQLISLSTLL
ncbi:MADS-box protein JOINTLESS-like isoform X4 [Prosopis cineraria]|uniref:MADS-box protein JOINTLESS-like isoform X4 n=1 Tax=Prosopis cineraria TaxID=364024 RepID=UPI0024102243|nr:MADS-box protein JOINTLESS-like isoform X4 [Prosopis cineraria]XP_054777954.1 MADS-box protein JOINTLESS-like isoform X4 [Prosopis cineraria]